MKPLEHPDAALIKDLGGPASVARKLNYSAENGTQRVQNWIKRGIPARVKLDHPHLFLHRQARTAG